MSISCKQVWFNTPCAASTRRIESATRRPPQSVGFSEIGVPSLQGKISCGFCPALAILADTSAAFRQDAMLLLLIALGLSVSSSEAIFGANFVEISGKIDPKLVKIDAESRLLSFLAPETCPGLVVSAFFSFF